MFYPQPLTNEIIKAFAMAPTEEGGLGLSADAAEVWVNMWPQRLCPGWKAMFVKKIWGWQERSGQMVERVEAEVQ